MGVFFLDGQLVGGCVFSRWIDALIMSCMVWKQTSGASTVLSPMFSPISISYLEESFMANKKKCIMTRKELSRGQ